MQFVEATEFDLKFAVANRHLCKLKIVCYKKYNTQNVKLKLYVTKYNTQTVSLSFLVGARLHRKRFQETTSASHMPQIMYGKQLWAQIPAYNYDINRQTSLQVIQKQTLRRAANKYVPCLDFSEFFYVKMEKFMSVFR